MGKISIINDREVEGAAVYAGPCQVTGVRSSKLLSSPDYNLWLCLSELEDGAEFRWDGRQGDEGLVVLEGSLDIAGKRSPAGGAVVVENGVVGTARAIGPTVVAHMGSRVDKRTPSTGKYVHVGGPRGAARMSRSSLNWGDIWFDGSSCETCSLMLFRIHQEEGFAEKPISHSHSADEIIFVIEGSVMLGKRECLPLTAISIPADTRYIQVCGAKGSTFWNYRPREATMTRFIAGEEPVTIGEGSWINKGERTNDIVDVPGSAESVPA